MNRYVDPNNKCMETWKRIYKLAYEVKRRREAPLRSEFEANLELTKQKGEKL